jgi:hypothetical protein
MDGEGLTTDQLKSLEEYLPTQEEEGQVIAPCNQRATCFVRTCESIITASRVCGVHANSGLPCPTSRELMVCPFTLMSVKADLR